MKTVWIWSLVVVSSVVLGVMGEVAVEEERVVDDKVAVAEDETFKSIAEYSVEELKEMNLTAPMEITVPITVKLPTQVPLTVSPGQSFREAAHSFCDTYKLGEDQVDAITETLITELRNLEIYSMPLLSIPIFLKNKTDDSEFEAALEVYREESAFQAVVRFCERYGLNVYDNGKQLETLLFESISNLTKSSSAEKKVETKELAFEATQEEGQEVTNDKVKLFSLPVKIDEAEVELEFFNGDHLGTKVSEFCEEHGLNETIAKKPLVEAVLKYTEEIREKYPDSVWLDSV